jgi:hypothetical protein
MNIQDFIINWDKSTPEIRASVIDALGIYPIDEYDIIWFKKQVNLKSYDKMNDFMKNSIMWKLPTRPMIDIDFELKHKFDNHSNMSFEE